MNKIQFNIPVSISEWHVEYKPLPFGKNRKVKHFVAYDLINQQTSFSDEDYITYKIPKFNNTVTIETELISGLDETYNFIRKYYVYKKKSWMSPHIHLNNKYMIYLPYEYNTETSTLFEFVSGKSKVIKKNDKLFHLVKGMQIK
ncbi:hypothetical protein ROU88_08275 [Macrococcus capreoli]